MRLLLYVLAVLPTPPAWAAPSPQGCPSEQVFSYSASSFDSSFGSALSLDENTLVVGKPSHRIGAGTSIASTGAAYVYERASDGSPWVRTEVLAPGSDISEDFGASLSLSGDRLVIGAPYAQAVLRIPDSGYRARRPEPSISCDRRPLVRRERRPLTTRSRVPPNNGSACSL